MKNFGIASLLFLLVACNSNPAKPGVNTPGISIGDSGIVNNGKSNPFAMVDVSPMDMSYLPADYPVRKMSGNAEPQPVARVIYSRPHRQGRTIFGGLLKYGESWRLGANEASEIEFFKPVTIQERKIKAGRYIIYCIPFERKWTIVLNSNLFTWGLKIDSTKDLHHFEIPVTISPMSLEYFTMVFEEHTGTADLLMAWENVTARLPIQF